MTRRPDTAQGNLFSGSDLLAKPMAVDPKTLSHRDDPSTSAEAATAGEESGRFSGQRLIVWEALCKHPNTTPCELAERAGLNRSMVSRRLPELARLKPQPKAERLPARRCTVAGTNQHTWRALENTGDSRSA